MIGYLTITILKRFSLTNRIIRSSFSPSIQMQYLVRALFFLFVTVILILAIIHAIRTRRNAMRKNKPVEFSIMKQFFASYQDGFFYLGALCAAISIFLVCDQMVHLISTFR